MLPGGDTGLHYLYFPSQISQRDTRAKDQGLKRTFGDATVQDCSGPLARSERYSTTDGTPISAPGRALGYSTSPWERPPRIPRGRKLSPEDPASEEPRLSWIIFFFLSSRGQVRVRFVKLLVILTPPSYHPLLPDVSHLGRVFPSFLSLPHDVSPSQQVWADLVRTDPPKAQDGHSLKMLKRFEGRSRIEGAAPARKIEGQYTTPGPVPVEQDFAGEEPESVDEDLAGGKPGPSAESPGRISGAGHNTWARASGKSLSVPSVRFKTMAESLRVLGLPELHDVSSPVKMPSIRSAVELSNEDPVSDALPREKFRSAGGENSSFHAAPRNFSNLGRVEFPAPSVITREEQAAREMEERAIPPAAA